MGAGNELTELYDCISVLYQSLPPETAPGWESAVKSVLYGGELLADAASCYGKQQKQRNFGKRKEYVRRRGNGERVTEFGTIKVAEPRTEDQKYVPSGAVLPVAPESGKVLPVNVSQGEVDRAITLLAEFPAEPAADQPGSGVDVLLDPERVRRAQMGIEPPPTSGQATLLFVSDTHLGYENRKKTGRGKKVPWIDEISTPNTFSRIVRIAVAQEVDAVIHTGDILDHEVDMGTLESAEDCLRLLSDNGIKLYCILGTHDHGSAEPRHSESVNGIAWLKEQIEKGNIIESTTNPTQVAGRLINLYGISAGNVGVKDIGDYKSRDWSPSEIAFGASSSGTNLLCLHDTLTPYRKESPDINLNQLLAQSRVSFDCVLVGDEHRPAGGEFNEGYEFETKNGTPVLYTGPAVRISDAYCSRDAFVTEITISNQTISTTRHSV